MELKTLLTRPKSLAPLTASQPLTEQTPNSGLWWGGKEVQSWGQKWVGKEDWEFQLS